MIDELTILIIAGFFILSFIVQGIIGIVRKEIFIKKLVWNLLFLPGNILMKILFFILRKTGAIHNYDEAEKGTNAVFASIGLLLFAFLLTIFFGYGAVMEYGLLSEEIADSIVVVSLCAIIFLTPIGIVIHYAITRKNKK